MPAPVPPDPDAVSFARERRATGLSLPAIAAEMAKLGHPVTAMTISRWLADPSKPKEVRGPKRKAAAQRPGAAMAARKPPSDPPAPVADGAAGGTTLDVLRRQLKLTLDDCEANRVINPKLAQQLGRDAASLANTIARLEKGEEDDSDQLRFSRRDIDQAMAGLLERIAAAAERCKVAGGLLCARCSRELSVDLGTGGVGSVGSDPVPRT
jgi:hypothetical protein